jgi:hypothetical protein
MRRGQTVRWGAQPWLSEHQRAEALAIWNVHHKYHRPHGAVGGQLPAAALAHGVANVMHGVTNVMASYT